MRYAFLTADGLGLPLAYHLEQSGAEVYVGQVNDFSQIKVKRKEKPEERDARLHLYDGMLRNKWTAESLTQYLLNHRREADDWFIWCDFNFLWPYAERLRKAGFRGLLPHRDDWELERDRAKAKQFVEQNYPNLAVAEFHDFLKVSDAIKFLDKEEEKLWVLKSHGQEGDTIVPTGEDVDKNHAMIRDSLERHAKEYQTDGFVLEEKIPDLVEFTPEGIAFDGKVIGVDIDIESKLLGARTGEIVGSNLSLVFWQEEDSVIYGEFLSPMEKVMLREGELTIWDAAVAYSPSRKEYLFLEYCSNRPGYDSLYAEVAMFGSAEKFFDGIISGDMHSEHKYGASARLFNLGRKPTGEKYRELFWGDPAGDNIWVYDVLRENGNFYLSGHEKDTAAVTGAGDTPEEAITDLYKNLEGVDFLSAYYLDERQWYDKEYHHNVLHRYDALQKLEL
jgi:hypothetical protein